MRRWDLLLAVGIILFALALASFYVIYGMGVSKLVFDGCPGEARMVGFRADLDAPRLRVRVSGAAALALISAERGVIWEARLENGEYRVPLVEGEEYRLIIEPVSNPCLTVTLEGHSVEAAVPIANLLAGLGIAMIIIGGGARLYHALRRAREEFRRALEAGSIYYNHNNYHSIE